MSSLLYIYPIHEVDRHPYGLCVSRRRQMVSHRGDAGRSCSLDPERKSKWFSQRHDSTRDRVTRRANVNPSLQPVFQPPSHHRLPGHAPMQSTKSILHCRQSHCPSYAPHTVPDASLRSSRVDVCQKSFGSVMLVSHQHELSSGRCSM